MDPGKSYSNILSRQQVHNFYCAESKTWFIFNIFLLTTRPGNAMCTICCKKPCRDISNLTKRRTTLLSTVFPSLSYCSLLKLNPSRSFVFVCTAIRYGTMQCLMVTFYTNKCTRTHTYTHTDLQATDKRWIQTHSHPHTRNTHTYTHTHTLTQSSQVESYVSPSSTNSINILVAEPKVAIQYPTLWQWTEHCACCIPFLFSLKIILQVFWHLFSVLPNGLSQRYIIIQYSVWRQVKSLL